MPCGHYFTHEALFQWLRQNSTCPVCRFEIPTADQEYNARRLLILEHAERQMLLSSRQPADVIGQRMARARHAASEKMVADALDELPAAPHSGAGEGIAKQGGGQKNALLRELHREREERARQWQEEERDEMLLEEALVEALLAKQRWIVTQCAQPHPVLDVGLYPVCCF